MKDNHKNKIIIILSIAVGLLLIWGITNFNSKNSQTGKGIENINNTQTENKITVDDFNILSTSWDDYQITPDWEFTNKPINWDYICKQSDYNAVDYTIYTEQTKDLACYFIMNNKKTDYWSFLVDKKAYHPSIPLSYKQDNIITICCGIMHSSENPNPEEICKSIILLAKCK